MRTINNQRSSYVPLVREYEDEILRAENTRKHLEQSLVTGGETEQSYKAELEK